jgi:hypothetical protein
MAKGKGGGTVKQYQDKTEYAYKFYLNQGWTPEQASGIVGNLLRESGLNPNAIGDSGKAVGLAQWHPDRQSKAKQLYGDKWKEFHNQLAFVDWELKNSEKTAGEALKKSKGVWQAGQIFTNLYERPKVKFNADDTRQKFVADTYRNYGKRQLTSEDRNLFINNATTYAPANTNSYDYSFKIDVPAFAQNTNLMSVPDMPEEEKKDSEAMSELKTQQAEKNFLEDYYKAQQEYAAAQQQQAEEEPQTQEITPIDVIGAYNQASQFVEQPLALVQQGGVIKDQQGQRK